MGYKIGSVSSLEKGTRANTPELVLWVSSSLKGATQRIFCALRHSFRHQQMIQVQNEQFLQIFWKKYC